MDNSNFYSIDRLVEFGLSLSIAQQMVQTMNHAMQSMYVPGSMASMPQAQVAYVAIDGEPVGPLSDCEFAKLLKEGRISKDTLAWMPGMPTWKPVEQVPELLKIVALTPPPINNL
jgi:hypothetical protein